MDSICVYGHGKKRTPGAPLLSGDKLGALRDIAEQQADPQDKQPRGPQGSGVHLAYPGKPPLHGLGKEDIGNRFQNKEQAKYGDKKFHGRTLPVDHRFFKIRIINVLHQKIQLTNSI